MPITDIRDLGIIPCRQAAKLLGITRQRLFQLIKSRQIPTIELSGNSKAILEKDLILLESRVKGRPKKPGKTIDIRKDNP